MYIEQIYVLVLKLVLAYSLIGGQGSRIRETGLIIKHSLLLILVVC